MSNRGKRKRSKKELERAVSLSTSWATLIKNLNLKVTGGNYANLQKCVREYRISTSHFTGQGWSKGKTQETDVRVARVTRKITKYNDDDLLVENAPYWCGGRRLRSILIRKGIPYKCSICTTIKWMEKPLTLHVDHVNGNKTDNRIENLRFLCPNCHQQTPTWGAKNIVS